ncbi:hypothetical protein [Psychrobacillus sp. L3]|uniref:hypothetical protein n=1 Tax=Psychrobacillus sp. L3 TaxID=3236891 RepID=UPI0036F1EA68
MVNSLGILLIAAVIVKLEVPALLKNKDKIGLIIFSALLALGVGFGMALAFNIKIPNPVDFLTVILKPLNDIITNH